MTRFRAPTGIDTEDSDSEHGSSTSFSFSSTSTSTSVSSCSTAKANRTTQSAVSRAPTPLTREKSFVIRHCDVKKSGKRKGKATTPASMDAGGLEKFRMNVKVKEQRARWLQQWSFVYVSNLNPTISSKTLKQTFQHCGEITHIIMRCSGGTPVKGKLSYDLGDHIYATIHFTEPKAVPKAIELNGTKLEEVTLVVCAHAIDLPETARVVEAHCRRKRPRTFVRTIVRSLNIVGGELNRLVFHGTEADLSARAQVDTGTLARNESFMAAKSIA